MMISFCVITRLSNFSTSISHTLLRLLQNISNRNYRHEGLMQCHLFALVENETQYVHKSSSVWSSPPCGIIPERASRESSSCAPDKDDAAVATGRYIMK